MPSVGFNSNQISKDPPLLAPGDTVLTASSETPSSLKDMQNTLKSTSNTYIKAASDTPPSVIILDVGGRNFKTLLSTLTSGSEYFRALFSGDWPCTPDHEGAYFVDADPDTFEHLLQYMRRPGSFPLFWSKASGFDYGIYKRLGHEAEFFQIDKLSTWIEKQEYLDDISIKINTPVEQSICDAATKTIKGNEEVGHHFVVKTRHVYLCPRGIPVHRGHQEMCGTACHKAQAGAGLDYDKEQNTHVISYKNQFILNKSANSAFV